MRFTSPADIPTSQQVFSTKPAIHNTIKRHTRSIYPAALLLLTPQEVSYNLRNVASARVEILQQLLEDHDLHLRDEAEPTQQAIIRLFGSLEDAPVAILQMTPVPDKPAGRTKLSPLEIIEAFETFEKKATVADLIGYTARDLAIELNRHRRYTPEVLHDRITVLRMRLRNFWNCDLRQTVRHLQSVSS